MSDTKMIFKLRNLSRLKQFEETIKQQKGVVKVERMLEDGKIKANVDSSKLKLDALNRLLTKMGYQIERIITAEA